MFPGRRRAAPRGVELGVLRGGTRRAESVGGLASAHGSGAASGEETGALAATGDDGKRSATPHPTQDVWPVMVVVTAEQRGQRNFTVAP